MALSEPLEPKKSLLALTTELEEIQRQMTELEALDDMDDVLDSWLITNAQITEKVDAYATFFKTFKVKAAMYDGQVKAYQAEADEWREKRDSALNAAAKLQERMKVCMERLGVSELAGELFTAALQTNSSASVSLPDDLKDIPSQYLKIEAKTADIKKALAAGVEVPGCELLPRGKHVRFK